LGEIAALKGVAKELGRFEAGFHGREKPPPYFEGQWTGHS
jgi:hypothetical protein